MNKQIKVESTFDRETTYNNPLIKDIVCGNCGNIYPKVSYQVKDEDLEMTMLCDEGCGATTKYKFWKKSGQLHLSAEVEVEQ